MIDFSTFDVKQNYSVKKMNSWRVGGLAQYFFEPQDEEQLVDFIRFLHEQEIKLPLHWLGLGSNVLLPDETLAGIVIRTRKLQACTFLDDHQVYAACGLACAKLAKQGEVHGYEGSSFFAGIPGTVGGALFMNAGAFGAQTWEHVIRVKWLHADGRVAHYDPSDFTVRYRHVQTQLDGWFLGGWFHFPPGLNRQVEPIKTLLAKRNKTQPIGTYNCGSVFKNPPGAYAAALIESCGLKGLRIGGAMISSKHANFIENMDDSATAEQIIDLMALIQDRVFAQHGIELEPEVIILGNKHDKQ